MCIIWKLVSELLNQPNLYTVNGKCAIEIHKVSDTQINMI